ncbi:MAG: hypothetical protein AB7G40_01345 [Hyphomonadaceae bacterium]
MTANVIQHTKPRRKRGSAWSWTARHIVLLVVVIAGIIAASWLAPNMSPPSATAPPAPPVQTAAPPTALPSPAIVDVTVDLAGPPAPVQRLRQPARRTGVPLNAAVTPADDYEILSAAELEGISQARD